MNVGKKALKTGIEVLCDTVNGANVKTALKKRTKQNMNEMIQSSIKAMKQKKSIKRKKAIKGRGSKKYKRESDFIF